ncbi:transcriptional regulator HexR [Stenotrophobium rhamnosiphilum]|uniref:Transcriptional regulator n=1 Tax=Stenotrophobium rhamnosiphilum TaxID=2029166 RepID=A0A2T5MD67_9GAMM|nr:transcriptional regulator HexR [Stenotrophobium rhamnosiphilum]PTU30508.1 transcriptional regulator [Stenotrophobium rhamnosiphilum]
MLTRVKGLREQLRKSEQRVADLVIARPNQVLSLSISAIAELAEVSEPTVLRFCRAAGCDGYRDFKLHLARSLATGVSYVHSDVGPNDSVPDLVAKVFDSSIAALIQVRNQLDMKALQRAVKILSAARKIEFYGQGNSGIVAQDAQHKFFRLRVHSVAYSDPHIHSMAATMLKRGDAVVAISNTGRTIDLLRSLELAREAGADVISITHSGSPVAKLSTVALYADCEEDPEIYTPMTSRIAHLAIIDSLAVGVALQRGVRLTKELERAKGSLKQKRVLGYDD